MANHQDIDRAARAAREALKAHDLERATQSVAELAGLEKSFATLAKQATDPAQKLMAEEWGANAATYHQDLKRELDALSLDMMDPQFAERARQREADKASREAADRAKAADFLSNLGGPFAALAGLANAGAQSAQKAAAKLGVPVPGGEQDVPCPSCQTANPKRAKFCMECGKPMARRCGSCGADLGKAKFCPECGTKAP